MVGARAQARASKSRGAGARTVMCSGGRLGHPANTRSRAVRTGVRHHQECAGGLVSSSVAWLTPPSTITTDPPSMDQQSSTAPANVVIKAPPTPRVHVRERPIDQCLRAKSTHPNAPGRRETREPSITFRFAISPHDTHQHPLRGLGKKKNASAPPTNSRVAKDRLPRDAPAPWSVVVP